VATGWVGALDLNYDEKKKKKGGTGVTKILKRGHRRKQGGRTMKLS